MFEAFLHWSFLGLLAFVFVLLAVLDRAESRSRAARRRTHESRRIIGVDPRRWQR